MAGSYPTSTDTDFTLIRKAAWNFYDRAVTVGVTGLNPPSWNDTDDVLLKKIAYYTASIVDAAP